MKLISYYEAAKMIDTTYSVIKEWVEEGRLKKYEEESGKPYVEKRELLNQIPTVITLFNQKGGVGKTSNSIILGDYYETQNKKVLLVDFDPQSSLTLTSFSYKIFEDNKNPMPTLYDYFEKRTALQKIVIKYNDNIDILPASYDLESKAYIDTADLDEKIKDFITLFKKYQIVVIDCPPAFNAMSRLGLLLANYVILPIQPEPLVFRGLRLAMKNIEKMKKFNARFIDFKIMICLHEARTTKIRASYEDAIRQNDLTKENVFTNSIPNFIGVVERGSNKENIYKANKLTNPTMEKIKIFCDELDSFIYDERE